MTTIQDIPQSMRSREHLEKLFHVLMTPTMYTQIEHHSTYLKCSKGALIRMAMDDYLRKKEEEDALDYLRRMDAEQS